MIDDIHKRLLSWSRWRLMGNFVLMARPSVYFLGQRVHDSEAPHAALVPVTDVECSQTDRAVHALPPVLQRVIVEFYCRTQTVEQLQARLGMSERTVYRRVDDAHRGIAGLLADMRAGRRVLSWQDQQRVQNHAQAVAA